MRVSFADCTLDTGARQLQRSGRPIHLSPKAFSLLALLVELRPRAVSKAELLEKIWPDVFVSEASLTRVVNEVRAAIGDSARRPRLVRTVHAFGYAFVGDALGEAGRPEARSLCWFACGEQRFDLTSGERVIGRDADADVRLDSPRVSRRHARLAVDGARVVLSDLGSKNGTFVRGTRVDGDLELKPGDLVRIGPFSLVFTVAATGASTETEEV